MPSQPVFMRAVSQSSARAHRERDEEEMVRRSVLKNLEHDAAVDSSVRTFT